MLNIIFSKFYYFIFFMKYFCSNCSYFYDEIIWDVDLWIEPGISFDSLPNDFFCPFCDTHKDDFVLLESEIYYISDIYNMTNLEKIHMPEYEISWDILKYNLEHDVKPDHFISKIELYDDSWDLVDTHFFWKDSYEISWVFDLDYVDWFEFRVYCVKEWIFSSWVLKR